jgi:hypothetical protein
MDSLNHRFIPTRIAKNEGTLVFISLVKRGKYASLSKLYDGLRCSVNSINNLFSCHLITYPYVSVLVECGNSELLHSNLGKIQLVVESTLWESIDY